MSQQTENICGDDMHTCQHLWKQNITWDSNYDIDIDSGDTRK